MCMSMSFASSIRYWEIGPRTENWPTEWNRKQKHTYVCVHIYLIYNKVALQVKGKRMGYLEAVVGRPGLPYTEK